MTYNNSPNYKFLLLFSLFKKVFRGFLYSYKFTSKHFVAIGKNVKILGKKKDLIIGKRVKIEDNAFIQSVCKNKIIFGDNVTICQNALIRPSGFYGGGAWFWLKNGKFFFNWSFFLYWMFRANYNRKLCNDWTALHNDCRKS